MKGTHLAFFALCCMIGMTISCGKKGDPGVPVIPLPLPISDVSVRLGLDSVVLSWNPPTHYTTNKTLELDDIRNFTILRKTEAPVANRWEFSDTFEGWSEAGKTLPLKRHKGILRAASGDMYLIMNSPEKLNIQADKNRYIRLKLWAKNSQQGYVVFITEKDKSWDTHFDLRFHPAVHTSYYSFYQAFKSVKVKPFRIIPGPPERVHEYVLDMQTLPTWAGKIQQIGIVFKNTHPSPENEGRSPQKPQQTVLPEHLLEVGLDGIEFVKTLKQSLPVYEAPPWVFLDDEEGWTCLQSARTFGASDGVLYAQGNDRVVLLSRQGQQIHANDTQQITIRMNVTEGEEAYLLLNSDSRDLFPDLDAASTLNSPHAIRIPLQGKGQFHSYTIDMNPSVGRSNSGETRLSLPRSPLPSQERFAEQSFQSANIGQIALVFPAVTSGRQRQIAIDYIDVVSDKRHAPLLTQFDLPPLEQIANSVQTLRLKEHLDFDIPYPDLSDEKIQLPVTQITLARISPQHPAPAEVRNNIFFLTDTGQFRVDVEGKEESMTAALEYGNRYTYQILVTDRKKRQSKLSPPLTVEFVRSPAPPKHFSVIPGDERITLTWDRPIFTVDGKKIRHLAGYQIFRSQTPAEYLKTPPRGSEAASHASSGTLHGTDVPADSHISPVSDTPLAQEIQAAPASNPLMVTPKTLVATLPATQTHFTDTGLLNGRRYYYTIVARTSTRSDFGLSEHSQEVVGVPVDNRPPAAPTGLVGVYLNDVATLHWKQGGREDTDVAGFYIFRSDSAAGPFQQLNAEPVFKASYADVTVKANRRYYYRITAVDDELPPNESLPSEMTLVETFSLD